MTIRSISLSRATPHARDVQITLRTKMLQRHAFLLWVRQVSCESGGLCQCLPVSCPLHHVAEWVLTLFVMFGRQLTGVEWTPLVVHFQHPPPPDQTEYQRIF